LALEKSADQNKSSGMTPEFLIFTIFSSNTILKQKIMWISKQIRVDYAYSFQIKPIEPAKAS
jgi:hypothetical protein